MVISAFRVLAPRHFTGLEQEFFERDVCYALQHDTRVVLRVQVAVPRFTPTGLVVTVTRNGMPYDRYLVVPA